MAYGPRKRINKVMNYVSHHRGESHSLERLAAIVHYSDFHFHRLFKSLTGQTPIQFVWHQRLDRAARILAYDSRQKITETAQSCGFSNSANFSKAFRHAFGMSPRDLRGNASYLRT